MADLEHLIWAQAHSAKILCRHLGSGRNSSLGLWTLNTSTAIAQPQSPSPMSQRQLWGFSLCIDISSNIPSAGFLLWCKVVASLLHGRAGSHTFCLRSPLALLKMWSNIITALQFLKEVHNQKQNPNVKLHGEFYLGESAIFSIQRFSSRQVWWAKRQQYHHTQYSRRIL